jgi:hypothetical protein
MQRLAISIFVMASLIDVAVTAEEPFGKEPILARVVKRNLTNKNQYHKCIVDLTLANYRDIPVWFLISSGNELLRYDGNFVSRRAHWPNPFDGKMEYTSKARLVFEATRYDGGNGTAIILRYGGDGGFHAVLLPPMARFHFARFDITTRDPPRFIDVWEVKSIIVNGKNRLEQFLPFAVMSSKTVEIRRDPVKPHVVAKRSDDDKPFNDPTVTELAWPKRDEQTADHDVRESDADVSFGNAAHPKPDTPDVGGDINARGDQEIKSVKADVFCRHVIPLPE